MDKILHSPKSLAALGWLSTFAMIWLMVLKIVEPAWPNFAALAFFLLIAIFASAVSSPARKPKNTAEAEQQLDELTKAKGKR